MKFIKRSQNRIHNYIAGLPRHFNFDKKELIDFAFSSCKPVPASFADLGGIWNVDGAYTFYTLRKYQVNHAFLIDTDFTDTSIREGQSIDSLKFIQGNFGEDSVVEQIGKVDAVFLFDVLLHQVNPDWNDIIKLYSQCTNYFIIFNPQWTGSKDSIRLLNLGRDEYFKNVPHNKLHPAYKTLFEKMYEINPQHQRIWRDIHNVWQWGITDCDLLSNMENLEYEMRWTKNYGRWGNLPNFENHAFVFQKK